jgi:hypothetical protein
MDRRKAQNQSAAFGFLFLPLLQMTSPIKGVILLPKDGGAPPPGRFTRMLAVLYDDPRCSWM